MQRRFGAQQEIRNPTYRKRNVVLDAEAFALLCIGDVFAQRPELVGLRQRLRNDRVDNHAVLDGIGERSLRSLGQRRVWCRIVELHQAIPTVSRQYVDRSWYMPQHKLLAGIGKNFEAGEAIAEFATQIAQ